MWVKEGDENKWFFLPFKQISLKMINNIPVANVVLLPTKYMYMLSVIAETNISCLSLTGIKQASWRRKI